MTKRQQVTAVAHATGLTARQARDALDAVSAVIGVALLEDGRVTLTDVGTFTVQRRRERRITNPSTGMLMTLPASAAVKFRPTPDLRKRVEDKHA